MFKKKKLQVKSQIQLLWETMFSDNYKTTQPYMIVFFILALALVSYLVRIVVPLGKTVLDFPTLAYLPQYLSFFVVGYIAYRHNWFRTLPRRMGVVGFVTAMVATFLLFPIPILGILGGTFRFLGNGTWPSAVYALWDSTFAVGMTLAAITFFRRFFNGESRFGRFLSSTRTFLRPVSGEGLLDHQVVPGPDLEGPVTLDQLVVFAEGIAIKTKHLPCARAVPVDLFGPRGFGSVGQGHLGMDQDLSQFRKRP